MEIFNWIYDNPMRIDFANFCSTEFFLGIDYWSFFHLMSGILLMYFIFKCEWQKKYKLDKWTIMLIGIIGFELFELYFFMTSNRFFLPSSFTDFVWDVFVGMFGGWIYLKVNSEIQPKNR